MLRGRLPGPPFPQKRWLLEVDLTNYGLADIYILVDGKKYGNCIVFADGDYHCRRGASYIDGYRKFRCLTQFTAEQVNAGT